MPDPTKIMLNDDVGFWKPSPWPDWGRVEDGKWVGPASNEECMMADRIEALEAALCDAAALLPPERWRLLQPSTREALDAGSRGEGSSEPAPRPGRLVAMETRLAREADAADRIEALEAALREAYGDVRTAKRVLEEALDA